MERSLMMIDAKTVCRDLALVRERAPLVHNITNYVVMNTTANALLALGASPIMAHAKEEVEELVRLSAALVVNIGTLSTPWIVAMHTAAKAAKQHGVPLVLDPVGAGASLLRTETAVSLLKTAHPAVVRGNPTEILALAGKRGASRGVDSLHAADAAEDAAVRLAEENGCVVVASGEEDLVTDGDRVVRLSGGHGLMPRVTGMGCAASAVVGAFAAVTTPLDAAVGGMAVMKVAGEIAGEGATGPGSFQVVFLDALFALTEEDIRRRLKLS